MLFGTLITAARAQEREAGVDFHELACYASALTPYVQSHLSRTLRTLELLYLRMPPEVIDESRQRELWEKYREAFVLGLRETLDHVGIMLAAVGCTEAELESLKDAEKTDGPSGDDVVDDSVPLEEVDADQAEDEGEKEN